MQLKLSTKMRNINDIKGEVNTITYDRNKIEEKVGSIYEAIVIMGKRAEQIDMEIRTELHNATLEEVFENREQIEISKYYEKFPKATSIAIREWLDGDIYFRKVEK